MKAIRTPALRAPALAVALLALGVAACDRTHMSANFGEANRAAFHAQVIDPDAGNETRPSPSLDPEEAATIARTHLKSLAPPATAGAAGYRDPILVVPSGGVQGTGTPAPSPEAPK